MLPVSGAAERQRGGNVLVKHNVRTLGERPDQRIDARLALLIGEQQLGVGRDADPPSVQERRSAAAMPRSRRGRAIICTESTLHFE